jgi:hypothetical protein
MWYMLASRQVRSPRVLWLKQSDLAVSAFCVRRNGARLDDRGPVVRPGLHEFGFVLDL